MQQSLMLFEDSAGRVSQGHPPSPSPGAEEIECTNAQPLMFPDDEDMGIPPQHVSDDDKHRCQLLRLSAVCRLNRRSGIKTGWKTIQGTMRS